MPVARGVCERKRERERARKSDYERAISASAMPRAEVKQIQWYQPLGTSTYCIVQYTVNTARVHENGEKREAESVRIRFALISFGLTFFVYSPIWWY